MSEERRRPGQGLITMTLISSILYIVIAVNSASAVLSSNINSGAKTSMIGALLTTATLFMVAGAVAFTERHRAAAPIPILGASLFGIFVCVFFVGSWV